MELKWNYTLDNLESSDVPSPELPTNHWHLQTDGFQILFASCCHWPGRDNVTPVHAQDSHEIQNCWIYAASCIQERISSAIKSAYFHSYRKNGPQKTGKKRGYACDKECDILGKKDYIYWFQKYV